MTPPRPQTTVRPTTPADAVLLPAIERSAGTAFRVLPDLAWIADGAVQSPAFHRRCARAGWAWVAADAAGEPFGFLSAQRFGRALHVWELAVRRDRQGEGAGRSLMDAAVAAAKGRGLAEVTLTTFRGVAWNEPLYARWGFETLGPAGLNARLTRVLAHERAIGLPGERRCAMRLTLPLAADPSRPPSPPPPDRRWG